MKLYYDKQTDYLEVYFQDYHKEPSYISPFGVDEIKVFHAEVDHRVIGYGFVEATKIVNKSKLLGVKIEFKGDKAKVKE